MEPVGKTTGSFFEPSPKSCVYPIMKDLHPKRTDLKERVMSIIESQTEEDLKQEFDKLMLR